MMIKKSPIPTLAWSAPHQWKLRTNTLIIIVLALSAMGIGEGLLVLAQLGSTPWTVLSQGLALQFDISIGVAITLVSFVILLLWIPFKLRFGLGTLLNIFFIALFADLTVRYLPAPTDFSLQLIYMLIGIVIFGIGTAFYLSCKLGAGPRDGLMVGICLRYGWKVGVVRTCLEFFACLVGFLLGGTFGISTLLFAFSIGWIIQFSFLVLQRFHKRSDFS